MRQLVLCIAVGLVTLGACNRSSDAGQKKPESAAAVGNPELVFETNKGSFVVRLYGDKAPVSTANMLEYVKEGFYNGTVFHRVIPDFMIQGGGFTEELQQKSTHAPIQNEATNGLTNKRGTIAMARTNKVDSATAQFFINVKDNKQLDHSEQNFGYAVIGEVVSGMDVVDAIRTVPTRCPSWTGQLCTEKLPNNLLDVPKDPVVIIKVTKK